MRSTPKTHGVTNLEKKIITDHTRREEFTQGKIESHFAAEAFKPRPCLGAPYVEGGRS